MGPCQTQKMPPVCLMAIPTGRFSSSRAWLICTDASTGMLPKAAVLVTNGPMIPHGAAAPFGERKNPVAL